MILTDKTKIEQNMCNLNVANKTIYLFSMCMKHVINIDVKN